MDPQTCAQLETELRTDEGVRPTPYLDRKGKLTVGVGRNLIGRGLATAESVGLLSSRGFGSAVCSALGPRGCKWLVIGSLYDVPLTPAEIQVLLNNDIRMAEDAALRVFPALSSYSRNRQCALISMSFNLGEMHLREFVHMIAAVQAGDWRKAAAEALDSDWKHDVGADRSGRIAQQLEHG